MEVSRLTFTKETKEKMNRGLNHFQVGELRWKKLEECKANGKLDKARNRMDIVEMLGFPRDYNAVYSWIANQISRGYLRETLTGYGKNGRMEYEYNIIKSPNFDPSSWSRVKKDSSKDNTIVAPVMKPKTYLKPVEEDTVAVDNSNSRVAVDNSNSRVTIKYKELSIELDNINKDMVEAIIEKLATVAGQ